MRVVSCHRLRLRRKCELCVASPPAAAEVNKEGRKSRKRVSFVTRHRLRLRRGGAMWLCRA